MQHRRKDGKLALPGGTDCIDINVLCRSAICKVDSGEDVEAAAVREGKEELGITIVEGKEIFSFVSGNWRLHVYEVCSAGVSLYDFEGEPRNAAPGKHVGAHSLPVRL